ncbi:MAG: ornithine carbamoyltransferase [Hadesarchaea archaeon]|nr:MAG: ornithine carbamoyltransferase [Hadesarchaea archaeon]
MKVKHFLSIQDLTAAEIKTVLKGAADLKKKQHSGMISEPLRGKTLAMIFSKPSTRTRVSFETGMTQLGGHAIYLGWNDLQLGRGETIADTARTLSRYVDVITARLFRHEDIVELARYSDVPVINALTDLHHPCQTLADLMTIQEHKGGLRGIKVAWVGDGNNVCNSLMLGCTLVGADISLACPGGYEPSQEITEKAKLNARKNGSKVEITHNPEEAVSEADVVYTDVFVSMGMEKEREARLKAFKGYQVNPQLLALAKRDVIFMHCLPAMRGIEVTDEVIDGSHSVVWDQAENRLHAQKSLLLWLLKRF